MKNNESYIKKIKAKLKQELDRFIEILHELYGFYWDANSAFELYKKDTIKKLHLPGIIIANGLPDDSNAIILHSSTWNNIYNRNKENGNNIEKTRRYLLIMISEHWNHDLRKKLAKILEIENSNNIQCDIMGDLNKIRNDILHSRGKANKSVKGKIIKFKKNEQIKISLEIFNKIFVEIFNYFNELSLQKTGSIMYLDRSLNQKAKEIHRRALLLHCIRSLKN